MKKSILKYDEYLKSSSSLQGDDVQNQLFKIISSYCTVCSRDAEMGG